MCSISSGIGQRRRVGAHQHHAPAAQDRDPVGDAAGLGELVGDDHHRQAVLAQGPHRLEQRLDLLGGQHAGRLVEDDQAGAGQQHLEDLDPLTLTDRQVLDLGGRVDRQPVALGGLADPARQLLAVEAGPDSGSASAMFSTTVNAGIRRRSWNTMPMPSSRPTAGERDLDRHAVDRDLALVGLVGAVDELHQRALAGAVLAEQGVHLAGRDLQVDLAVGDQVAEALGQPGDPQAGRLGGCGIAARRPASRRWGRSRCSCVATSLDHAADRTADPVLDRRRSRRRCAPTAGARPRRCGRRGASRGSPGARRRWSGCVRRP